MNIDLNDLLTIDDKEYSIKNITQMDDIKYYCLVNINDVTDFKFCYIFNDEIYEELNKDIIFKLIFYINF